MTTTTKQLPEFVLLTSTAAEDLGVVLGATAMSVAQETANTDRCTVYVRHTTTDKVLATVRPLTGRSARSSNLRWLGVH